MTRASSLKTGSSRRSADWIDVTVPLHSDMVRWPGDPAIRIQRVRDMDRGDANNVSRLSMGSHTGTHVDAPLHFVRSGQSLDRMPLDAMMGPARVIPIRDPRRIRSEELKKHRVRRGERILFKTRNSPRCWRESAFVKDFVSLSLEAAEMLAQRAVRMVGVDYLSVGGYRDEDGAAVHETLLGAGIWIVEGLNLSQVEPGPCELICLPLKLLGGDGAPARAIVRPSKHRRRPAGGSR